MAPDWLGVSAGAIDMAKAIAGATFAVFVADMYGAGSRPTTMDEAAALCGPLKSDAGLARPRIAAAFRAMRDSALQKGLSKAERCGAVGFCFGGLNVLELARTGADLAAAISIHGDLVTSAPAAPDTIKPPLLVLHGADDPISPKEQRDAFEAEMRTAKATWFEVVFGNAVHSFTDRQAAIAGVAHYDAFAADWAMSLTHQFLVKQTLDEARRRRRIASELTDSKSDGLLIQAIE